MNFSRGSFVTVATSSLASLRLAWSSPIVAPAEAVDFYDKLGAAVLNNNSVDTKLSAVLSLFNRYL